MVTLPSNQMWMDFKIQQLISTIPILLTSMIMQNSLNSHLKMTSTYPVPKFRGRIIQMFRLFRRSNTTSLLILDRLLHKNIQGYMLGPRIILRTKLSEAQMLVYKLSLPQVFKMNVISRHLSQWLNPNPSKKH